MCGLGSTYLSQKFRYKGGCAFDAKTPRTLFLPTTDTWRRSRTLHSRWSPPPGKARRSLLHSCKKPKKKKRKRWQQLCGRSNDSSPHQQEYEEKKKRIKEREERCAVLSMELPRRAHYRRIARVPRQGPRKFGDSISTIRRRTAGPGSDPKGGPQPGVPAP